MKSDLDAWQGAVLTNKREHCAPEVRGELGELVKLVALQVWLLWLHKRANLDVSGRRFDGLHSRLTSAGVPSQQIKVLRDLFITPHLTSRLKPYTATDPLPGE